MESTPRRKGLVLTRKNDDTVIIETPTGPIIITFECFMHRCKVRFECGDDIAIHRGEVYDERKKSGFIRKIKEKE